MKTKWLKRFGILHEYSPIIIIFGGLLCLILITLADKGIINDFGFYLLVGVVVAVILITGFIVALLPIYALKEIVTTIGEIQGMIDGIAWETYQKKNK